jgi:Na+/proline symporter
MVPSSLFWAAAQLRAFGQIISFSSDLPVTIAISISVVFVIFYTYLGGLLGDIYTDLIQGVIIMVGLAILIVLFLKGTPGLGEILHSMSSTRWSFIGPQETLLMRLDRWMVPILGSLTAQEALSRILAARTVRIARDASFVACGIYLVMGSIPVFLGLVGPFILHNLPDSEQFLITLAHGILPKAIFVVFAGALISTILSTIDSILIAISALISHNLIVPRFKFRSDRTQVLSARLVVVVAGLLAYVLAITSEGILSLVITASSFGTAGILVITLMGFYSRIGGPRAANLALLGGLLAWPLSEYVFHLQAPYLVSIATALALFFWGSRVANQASPQM